MFDENYNRFQNFTHILFIKVFAWLFLFNFEELHEKSDKLFGPRLVKFVFVVLEKAYNFANISLFAFLNFYYRLIEYVLFNATADCCGRQKLKHLKGKFFFVPGGQIWHWLFQIFVKFT